MAVGTDYGVCHCFESDWTQILVVCAFGAFGAFGIGFFTEFELLEWIGGGGGRYLDGFYVGFFFEWGWGGGVGGSLMRDV